MQLQHAPVIESKSEPALAPSSVIGMGLDIVHECRGRLRLKLPILGLPGLDVEHLSRVIRATTGAASVRINPAAISVVISYDGTAAARARILKRLFELRRDQLHFRPRGENDAPSPTPLVGRIAFLAAYPLLPPKVRNALGAAVIAPRVLRGVRTLVTEGVRVELLDALAVSVGAVRGGVATAVTTDLMMGAGEYLEETTVRHSGELLQELLMPNPETAWVEHDGGAVEVPFSTVKSGDIVVVNTGELVPVDGVVRGGAAQVNQASITGESLPVTKETGDSIIAGSFVEDGSLRIEAQKVGDETTTARITALIKESLEVRSDTERLAQKQGDRQVYMTLGLGFATLLLTRDLRRLSSVFLVDYACPIKLSAPVAVRATMADAVARGILIKGGPSIEKLAEIDTFVFDKTGTLTHGNLSVTDVVSLAPDDWSSQHILALSASVEEHSQHPIAKAIVNEARANETSHVSHGEVKFDVGYGLRATVDGREVLIGSRHFLEDIEAISFDDHTDAIEKLVEEGKMLLYVAVGGKPVGVFGLRDELRDDARATADRLRASGVTSLVMLTGDRKGRSERFAEALGFDEVHTELRPEDKQRILTELQNSGRKIAFVGDGVNDAPALAAANVGFSMSQGADIARAAADITLLDDRISAVADAREAAVQAMRIISANGTAAIGINTGLFIAASAGFLSPVAAAVLHNGSTIGLLATAIARAGIADRKNATPAVS